MKKIFTLILAVFCAGILFAQVPERFSYQAVVRNANNSLVANAQVGVRVNILQGSATGSAVYSESHVATTNANGLLTVNIGGGSVLHGSFAGIDWAEGPYFLKTDIDPNGGNDYTITSVQQLLSVPYALYAKEAGNGFSGDYNDLVNLPQIPQIPADVSAFNNDAGYITMDSVPAIPSVPTNVSAFTNDAGYLTSYTETDPQFNAWDKNYNDLTNKPTLFSGNYNDLTNKPTLFDGNYNSLSNKPNLSAVALSGSYNDLLNKPSIPTAVGELANNVGYITLSQVPAQVNADWNATTGAAQILNKPTLFDGNYNSLSNRPNLAPVATSGNYNDLINKPTIPTVPTYVSAFTNDAGYLTNFTETDPQFSAWDKDYNDLTNKPVLFDGDYNSLTNKPVLFDGDYNSLANTPPIPTVPSNVSAFNNDAGYVTAVDVQQAANIPTNLSAFENDANYITVADIPAQVNADWDATSGAAQILNKPTLFSGNYNDLTNKPTLFDGNYNSLSNRPDLAAVATTGNYNDLNNLPQIPQIPTDVSAFNNDAGYITESDLPAMPTKVSELTNDAGYITEYDLPAIPTVPTDVSAFNNDAGYVSNAACDGVDLCMLAALLTQLQYLVEQQQTRIEALESQLDSITSDTTTNPTDTIYPSNSSVGALPGSFSISATKKVNFSQGNLQYQASTNTWRFAENQWDIVGFANSNISSNYDGWIDLFGWGTSGYNNKYPWMTSTTEADYGDNQNNIANTNYDWGKYNPISNGGNQAGLWRTLSSAELNYMIYGRTNAGNLYSMGIVNGRHGLIILPDNCVVPDNISFTPAYKQFTNDVNNFTVEQWKQMEDVGAVFLPVAGMRKGTTVSGVDESGYYWSTDILTSGEGAKEMWFGRAYIYYNPGIGGGFSRHNGISVRLVTDSHVGHVIIDTTTTSTDTITYISHGIPCPGTPTVNDYDGNVYNTVQIGDQCWMKENLRTKHYATGTPIPFNAGVSYTEPRCFQNSILDVNTYGLYYNWYAAMNGATASDANPSGVQGVCPNGWHLPSKAEWNQLLSYLGENQDYVCGNSNSNIAQSMAANVDWQEYPSSCTIGFDLSQQNSSGFSALPAGWFDVKYKYVGSYCGFMSSTLDEITVYPGSLGVYLLTLSNGWSAPHNHVSWPYVSYSVRCLRD